MAETVAEAYSRYQKESMEFITSHGGVVGISYGAASQGLHRIITNGFHIVLADGAWIHVVPFENPYAPAVKVVFNESEDVSHG